MKKTSSFILGTILLATINFIVRVLGFIYRIILSRMIGSQAIGLYQMVFPFLMVLITLPTAGIPVAVSRLVAGENSLQNRRGVYRILSLSLLLGGLIAAFLTILVSFNMEFVTTKILKNQDLYYPLLWTIPAIGLITFSSILRGFFYGLKDIKPPAMAQILEQLSRITFVIALLYYIKPNHPITAATIAIIGLSVGELIGLLYLVFRFNLKKLPQLKNRHLIRNESIIRSINGILYISVPITISRLLSTFMQTINSIMIPQRLEVSGLTAQGAIDVFGKISGMAMPLLFLPFTVTSALVVNIIPNISEEQAINNYQEISNKTSLALKITLLTAIPITGLYVIFGGEMAAMIFNDVEVGQYLSLISYATLFLCMQNTLSGILHGLGKQVSTTINFLLGMLIQLYCTYFLVADPRYGIYGFIIGFILSSVVISILHSIILFRHVKIRLSLSQCLIKPILCTLLMLAVIFLSFNLLAPTGALLKGLCMLVGIMFYLAGLFLTKTIDIHQLMNNLRR